MRYLFSFIASLCLVTHLWGASIDMGAVEKELTGAGLQGWIHGAVKENRQYVFTYRSPMDFFSHYEFSLIPEDAAVATALSKLQRHDEVVIQGKFLANASSQKHILLSKVVVVSAYNPGVTFPPRTREADLPADLLKESSLLGVVHAVAAGGEILVVEYKDAVVPVFMEDTSWSKGLYRGDKILLHYTVQKSPKHPTHLRLDTSVKIPLDVREKITKGNGKPLTLEGSLVYFPKSPQIRFGVFAVQVVDSDDLKLNYTFLIDPDEVTDNEQAFQMFTELREKLQKTWNAASKTAVNGRNCLVNPKLRVRASGVKKVFSPNQANPQIFLKEVKSVEILP